MTRRSIKTKLRNFSANAALVAASLLFTYLVGEVVFFRLMLPHMSLNIKPHLPDLADVVTQNSKSGYVPHNYVALLGDSYAEGLGDWLLQTNGNRVLPFHAANVLHEKLGRDVISLGKSGYGSPRALVERVARVYGSDSCYLFPKIEPPKRIFAYFYEGNDLEDNFKFVARKIGLDADDRAGRIDRQLDYRLSIIPFLNCHIQFGAMAVRMASFVVKYHGAEKLLFAPRADNKALIDGSEIGVPALQMPPAHKEVIDIGLLVFDRALARLRETFPDVPVTIVYIPSPASLYRYATEEIYGRVWVMPFTQDGRPNWRWGALVPTATVYSNSQLVCEKIRATSLKHGNTFMDIRPVFRSMAARRPLHGPLDWNHFNETGYRLLAALLAPAVDNPPADMCDDRWDVPLPVSLQAETGVK